MTGIHGPLEILLVEDDDLDARVLARALAEAGGGARLHRHRDGEEALAALKAAASRRRLPDLVLLDLNLPRMTGLEFLEALRADPGLKRVPVVVLSTSRDGQERNTCFDLGVAGYFVKPTDYTEFVELVRVMSTYWRLSELPES